MKTTASLLAFLLLGAPAALAQSGEFGVLFGGSRRSVDNANPAPGTTFANDGFSFSNSSVDVYWAMHLEPDTLFKLKAGRIQGPVSFRDGDDRIDLDGEVQHVSGLVEYRFSEAFGSTGIYGGFGLYRHEAAGFSSSTDYGFSAGVTADFPLSRRYGVILDGAYHWTHADFRPRYLTLSGGVRIAF